MRWEKDHPDSTQGQRIRETLVVLVAYGTHNVIPRYFTKTAMSVDDQTALSLGIPPPAKLPMGYPTFGQGELVPTTEITPVDLGP